MYQRTVTEVQNYSTVQDTLHVETSDRPEGNREIDRSDEMKRNFAKFRRWISVPGEAGRSHPARRSPAGGPGQGKRILP
jgi:hypothetical protein